MHAKMLIKTLIMTLVVALGTPLSFIHAAPSEPEPQQVMLIYDSLAKGTSKAGNIDSLQRILAAYGVKVSQVTFDTYKKGTLTGYSKIIAVRNSPESEITNQDYLRDFTSFDGEYLHIGDQVPDRVLTELDMQIQTIDESNVELSIGQFTASNIHVSHMSYIVHADGTKYGSFSLNTGNTIVPFGVQRDRLAYVPYFEQGDLSEIAISYVLKDWLKVTEVGRTYLLFKKIYPFSDLKLLEDLTDKLYQAGIPFIVSVQPVFSNTDYPAMQRYLETLKYIQSHNGNIMINAPVVASTIDNEGPTLKAQMESFVDVLAEYGIAPLGIGAEMYWSYDQQYSEFGMGFFNSVAIFPNENIRHRSPVDDSQPFSSGLYSMPFDFLNQFDHTGKEVPSLPMNIALTYNFFETESEMNQIIQPILDSWITFDDYKYETHAVQTQAHTITSENGLLEINGQKVDMNEAYKSIDSDFIYKQEQKESLTKLFNIQNKIFIVLIVLTLIIFGLLFIRGYRIYKRKYFNQRREL